MQNRTYHWICVVAWSLFAGWAATIFILSSLSGPEIEPYMLRVPQWDKICHATAFATGAVILAFALRKTTAIQMRMLVPLVIVLISLFGALDEVHQLWTPGRSALDVWDWLADTLGATIGAFATYARLRIKTGGSARAAVAAGD